MTTFTTGVLQPTVALGALDTTRISHSPRKYITIYSQLRRIVTIGSPTDNLLADLNQKALHPRYLSHVVIT